MVRIVSERYLVAIGVAGSSIGMSGEVGVEGREDGRGMKIGGPRVGGMIGVAGMVGSSEVEVVAIMAMKGGCWSDG